MKAETGRTSRVQAITVNRLGMFPTEPLQVFQNRHGVNRVCEAKVVFDALPKPGAACSGATTFQRQPIAIILVHINF